MISMAGIYFLLFGPAIGGVIGFIVSIIISCVNSSKSPKTYSHSSSSSRCSGGTSYYFNEPDYNAMERNRILSSMESEMHAHNARVEQMMMEQENRRLNEEMYRQIHETEGSLAQKFDGRLTNIFRNPWEGIL